VPLKIATKLEEPHEWEYFHTEVEPLLGGDVDRHLLDRGGSHLAA
jgi:hypothetical protein